MEVHRRRRSGTRFAVAAACLAGATDFAYLAIIRSQGDGWLEPRVAFVAAFVAAAGTLAAVAAASADPRHRLLSLGAATGGLVAAGVVGIFSIGLPLLVGAAAAGIAWAAAARDTLVRGSRTGVVSVGLAFAAPAVLIVGIAIT